MNYEFTAVFEKIEDWYIGYVEELPGVNTQGKTLKEARNNLRDEVQLILESNRALAERDILHKKVVKESIQIKTN